MPPGLDAAADARNHPHSCFGRWLRRDPVVAGSRLVIAIDSGAIFPAKQRMHTFSGVTILLKPGVVVAALMVQHHESARWEISRRSRNERACEVTEPLFMPDQIQSAPPASRVARLFNSQTSIRLA